jgi:nucleoside 2-deoxyribosyltransferase
MGFLGSVRRPRCFLSTPLAPSFQTLRQVLLAAIQRAGAEVTFADFQTATRNFAETARELLRDSDFVIADLTTGNPNVIYEIGFAHGIGLPVLLLTQDLETAPADLLQDSVFLVYETSKLSELELRVVHWLVRQFTRGGATR